MTIAEMIEAIAQDAYEGATEDELRHVFMEKVTSDLRRCPRAMIEETYAEIVGDA